MKIIPKWVRWPRIRKAKPGAQIGLLFSILGGEMYLSTHYSHYKSPLLKAEEAAKANGTWEPYKRAPYILPKQ